MPCIGRGASHEVWADWPAAAEGEEGLGRGPLWGHIQPLGLTAAQAAAPSPGSEVSTGHSGPALLCPSISGSDRSSPDPQGFQRVYDELGDISLDVPLAHRILERLVDLCFEEGVITKQLRDTCPARYLQHGGQD